MDDKVVDTSFVDSSRLSETFPDILAGETFINHTMAMLDSSAKFEAIVIRIDDINYQDKTIAIDQNIDLLVDVAQVIDAICKKESGMWGQLDRDMFGCFFFWEKPNFFFRTCR
jgi:hypothetical protein